MSDPEHISESEESPAEESSDQEPRATHPLARAWQWSRATWPRRLIMDLSVLALALWAVMLWQTRSLVSTGEPAPGFELEDLDGNRVSLESFRGEKVILAFWAPWCTVCDLEASNLSSLAEHYREEGGATVLSVSLAYEDRADVDQFVADHDVDFPVLLGNRALADAYQIQSFPTIYVIDEDGAIEHSMVGYTTKVGIRARVDL